MPTWLSVILEIVKITVPAHIVFVTVYSVLKRYLDNQYRMRMLDFKQGQQKETLPLRLQAYERLSLFCERVSIPSLLLRLQQEDMNAKGLHIAMMIAIQKEFEHNITQQVYVSNNLWKIIKIAKDNTINTINLVADSLPPDSSSKALVNALFTHLSQSEVFALERALAAIKKEAGLLM